MYWRWLLSNNNDQPVLLSFDNPFWLESGYTTCYDTLTIYNGDSNSDSVVAELCGEHVPGDILLHGNK